MGHKCDDQPITKEKPYKSDLFEKCKNPDNRKSIITEFENHINKLDIFKKFKTNNTPTEIRLINGKT